MGIAKKDPHQAIWQKKTENYAHLPGSDWSNELINTLQREAAAVNPTQSRNLFKVQGNTVNILA